LKDPEENGMAITSDTPQAQPLRKRDPGPVFRYSLGVTAAFTGLLLFHTAVEPGPWTNRFSSLAAWACLAALADTLRVRLWNELSFAMSLPVTLAAGMVLSPIEASLVAFVGAFDRRDFRTIPPSRVLSNRAIAAISIYAGSSVFHLFGWSPLEWPEVLLASGAAYAADFVVNVLLIAYPVSVLRNIRLTDVVRRVLDPSPSQTVMIYLCVGLLAPVIALVSETAGLVGIAVLLLPLGLARTAYLQALRLQDVAERLHVKSRALQEVTQQVAEERRDERMTLAGELHDEVLPPLFKVHLMGQVLRQDLANGRLLQLDDDIPELLAATDAAQTAIRGVVRGLRDSPLGANGLGSTIRLFVDQLQAAGSGSAVHLDLADVRGTERALLVVYQVAREAVTNAVRYSRASEVHVRLLSEGGQIRLVVSDDGIGLPQGERALPDHFGLQLMRERAESAGGVLVVDSRIGEGTMVVLAVPANA
jgi:signal transduction histidine kinase